MVDFVHKALRQRPFAVAPGVVFTWFLAIFARRNDRECLMVKDKLDERVTIISAVRQHVITDFLPQQCLSLGNVVPFTSRQAKAQRIAQRIDFGMDFGAEPAPTTTQRLRVLTTVFLKRPLRTDARARPCCRASHFPGPDRAQTAPSCVPKRLCRTSVPRAYTRCSTSRIRRAATAIARRCAASRAPLPQTGGRFLLVPHKCRDTSGETPGFSSIGRQIRLWVS